MSIKSTQRISRERAVSLLLSEIVQLPNGTLEDLLDLIADSGMSRTMSKFDNFMVSEFDGKDD